MVHIFFLFQMKLFHHHYKNYSLSFHSLPNTRIAMDYHRRVILVDDSVEVSSMEILMR